MVLKVMAVYDSKVQAFNQPLFFRTKGEALRSWSEAVNKGDQNFCKYPEDYTLFEIGEYDDSTGIIKCLETKISLGTAIEHKRLDPQLPLPGTDRLPTGAERRLSS